MARVRFAKMEAVGNDFVLIDRADLLDADWPSVARRLCPRRTGVGGDGLLVVGPSPLADLRVRMFNPDGTEDQCGNGMRCAVLRHVGPLAFGEERCLTLETLAGLLRARAFATAAGTRIETEMSEPAFAPAVLPMTIEADRVVDHPLEVDGEMVAVTVVSTGTTHTVLFADPAETARRFERLSPSIENHPLFPERTSVLWTHREAPDRLRIRIWERGVGETLGCGTGACAAMVAARLHHMVGDRAAVSSRGGELEVTWPGTGPCVLAGSAREVFRGEFAL